MFWSLWCHSSMWELVLQLQWIRVVLGTKYLHRFTLMAAAQATLLEGKSLVSDVFWACELQASCGSHFFVLVGPLVVSLLCERGACNGHFEILIVPLK